MPEELEQMIIYIIANAGDSKSDSMMALEEAHNGNFAEADELLKHAEKTLLEAHQRHTELLAKDAKGEVKVSMLAVHASNHLSEAELTLTFAREIVLLREERGTN